MFQRARKQMMKWNVFPLIPNVSYCTVHSSAWTQFLLFSLCTAAVFFQLKFDGVYIYSGWTVLDRRLDIFPTTSKTVESFDKRTICHLYYTIKGTFHPHFLSTSCLTDSFAVICPALSLLTWFEVLKTLEKTEGVATLYCNWMKSVYSGLSQS